MSANTSTRSGHSLSLRHAHYPPPLSILDPSVKVATYTQPSVVTKGSLIAIALLILTILLGTSAIHSLLAHFAPAQTR
ncbi:MAG: hypothetical protein KTR32_40095, partial [Granulosicoccus sp.]|nr:hypothetical protein [Granulosicoccus sp.]